MQKYGSATQLGTAGWMWNLYYAQGVASNLLLRGGGAGTGSRTGVFTLYLNHTAAHELRDLGFRCAL
jgi:hypothetical protein